MLLSKYFFQLQCSGEKVQTYGNWRNFSKDREHLEFLFTNSTLAHICFYLPKLLFQMFLLIGYIFRELSDMGEINVQLFFSKNSVFTTGFIWHICLKSTWRLGVWGVAPAKMNCSDCGLSEWRSSSVTAHCAFNHIYSHAGAGATDEQPEWTRPFSTAQTSLVFICRMRTLLFYFSARDQ